MGAPNGKVPWLRVIQDIRTTTEYEKMANLRAQNLLGSGQNKDLTCYGGASLVSWAAG